MSSHIHQSKKFATPPKEEPGCSKVTVSINTKLLAVVDRYSEKEQLSRSAVFQKALLTWYEGVQEEIDRQFYSKEYEDPDVRSWGKVISHTARFLWNE